MAAMKSFAAVRCTARNEVTRALRGPFSARRSSTVDILPHGRFCTENSEPRSVESDSQAQRVLRLLNTPQARPRVRREAHRANAGLLAGLTSPPRADCVSQLRRSCGEERQNARALRTAALQGLIGRGRQAPSTSDVRPPRPPVLRFGRRSHLADNRVQSE
jgi:hypothetical protein